MSVRTERAKMSQQLLAVGEDAADADLVLRLAEEGLLARGADEVGVEVAVADVVERALAAELLVAGRDVDRGVAPPPPNGGRLSLKYWRSTST